ncbi:MAG: hypothetical protein R3B41_03535, partial [Candidatus Doudnabacteria bacterium]
MKKIIFAIIVVFFCTSMVMADLVYRSEDQIKKHNDQKLASYAKFWSVAEPLIEEYSFATQPLCGVAEDFETQGLGELSNGANSTFAEFVKSHNENLLFSSSLQVVVDEEVTEFQSLVAEKNAICSDARAVASRIFERRIASARAQLKKEF